MRDPIKTHVVSFPTPTLAALFPTLRSEAHRLRLLLEEHSEHGTESLGEYTRIGILMEVETVLEEAALALALFLAYPTRRLHDGILQQLLAASANARWLASNQLSGSDQETINGYAAHCEQIQAGIREWRLTVDMKSAGCDLEYKSQETLH